MAASRVTMPKVESVFFAAVALGVLGGIALCFIGAVATGVVLILGLFSEF